MKRIARILPHLTIVLSLMTLTFFVIDRVNVNMAFMTSELSKWVFAILAALSVITSILLIAAQWRADAKEARRLLRHAAREQRAADELFWRHSRPDSRKTARAADDAGEESEEEDDAEQAETDGDEETADDDAPLGTEEETKAAEDGEDDAEPVPEAPSVPDTDKE